MEELKDRLQNSWFKRLILIGECLLALAGVFAQSNTLQGTLGLDCGYLKDLNSTPLHYEEQGKTYTLWQDASALNKFSSPLDDDKGQFHIDTPQGFTTDYIRGNCSISYLRTCDIDAAKISDRPVRARDHYDLKHLDWNTIKTLVMKTSTFYILLILLGLFISRQKTVSSSNMDGSPEASKVIQGMKNRIALMRNNKE